MVRTRCDAVNGQSNALKPHIQYDTIIRESSSQQVYDEFKFDCIGWLVQLFVL